MSWAIEKTPTEDFLLLVNGEEISQGNIVDVSVPSDEDYEDEHIKVSDDLALMQLRIIVTLVCMQSQL